MELLVCIPENFEEIARIFFKRMCHELKEYNVLVKEKDVFFIFFFNSYLLKAEVF